MVRIMGSAVALRHLLATRQKTQNGIVFIQKSVPCPLGQGTYIITWHAQTKKWKQLVLPETTSSDLVNKAIISPMCAD